MATFVVTYTYSAAQSDERDTHRPAHREYLARLVEAGSMLSTGAHVDGSGGTLIASADSHDHVVELLRADPFVVHGLAGFRIVEWAPTLGAFA